MKKVNRLLLCVMVAMSLPVYAQTDKQPVQENKQSVQTDKQSSLDEVVVTGTGTRHLLKDVPVETQVITKKMLENYGGASLQDILSGLTSSFDFSEGDMGSQMQMNGLGNNYILILIDGKRLHGDVGGNNDLGLVDPHNIEKIEIVRGAHSALYGSDAIAGVINIITRKHDKESIMADNTTRVATGGGMDYDVRQHNGFGIGNKKIQSYTNFQLQAGSGWQNTTDEFAEAQVIHGSKNKTVNKFRNWQIAERITYNPTENMELYAEGTYYIKDIMRPHEAQRASIVKNGYDMMYRNASAGVGGKVSDWLTFDVTWNKHAYYYNYKQKWYDDAIYNGEIIHDFPYMPGDRVLQSDQQRLMASVKGIYKLPYNNLVSGGMEYRYDYLKAPMRVKDGKASDWIGALYVQDEFGCFSWLNITAGLRLNQNKSFGFRATPKVSAMLSWGDFRLRLNWSQGFKTPTPKELYYRYVSTMNTKTSYHLGNPNLDAQTNNYWSAGLEYRGKKLTASATAYINKLKNMITDVIVPVSEIPRDQIEFMGDGSMMITPYMYKNMNSARTCGIDLSVSYRITKEITVGGSYSYLDTDAREYNAKKERMDKVTIDGMAHNKWNAYATWQHQFAPSYQMTAGLYTRGSSKRYYQENGDGKGYQIWKLSTSHELGKPKAKMHYHLELGVDNIFNYVDRTMRPYHLGTTACGTNVFMTFGIRFKQGKTINTKIIKQTSQNEEN